MQPAPQDNQLMSKHRVLSLKPQLRLEWRGQDGQSETEQPDHSASLGDSFTSSTGIRFSVHTPASRISGTRSIRIFFGYGIIGASAGSKLFDLRLRYGSARKIIASNSKH